MTDNVASVIQKNKRCNKVNFLVNFPVCESNQRIFLQSVAALNTEMPKLHFTNGQILGYKSPTIDATKYLFAIHKDNSGLIS